MPADSSLRVSRHPEGPHMIGRESGMLRCHRLDFLAGFQFRTNSVTKRLWSLIGHLKDHHFLAVHD